MNLTSEQLRRIIQEELQGVMKEEQIEEGFLKNMILGLGLMIGGKAAAAPGDVVGMWSNSNQEVSQQMKGGKFLPRANQEALQKIVMSKMGQMLKGKTINPQNIAQFAKYSGKDIDNIDTSSDSTIAQGLDSNILQTGFYSQGKTVRGYITLVKFDGSGDEVSMDIEIENPKEAKQIIEKQTEELVNIAKGKGYFPEIDKKILDK